MINFKKLDGDNIFFLVFAPLVIGVVWYNWGFKIVVATALLFGGLYTYYFIFLNIIYALRDKNFNLYKKKIILFLIAGIFIFFLSLKYYGWSFALRAIVTIFVLSFIQSVLILGRR
jgi:hypothetical protein